MWVCVRACVWAATAETAATTAGLQVAGRASSRLVVAVVVVVRCAYATCAWHARGMRVTSRVESSRVESSLRSDQIGSNLI